MRPAVELSYLQEEEMRDLVDFIDNEEVFPSHAQTIRMRALSKDGKLDREAIDTIMNEEKAATVTVLVTPEQAELLAHYNSVTTIHFTLVYRGETDKADAYIKVQDDYLKNNPIDNTPKETEEENNG